jgi:hypothetical protein
VHFTYYRLPSDVVCVSKMSSQNMIAGSFSRALCYISDLPFGKGLSYGANA